ncbi:MAG: class I SAM-dependent methyltransferase [Mastigocladus sp. ERB_26_2]|uniref:Class I SAM-dependent methyltransferase n=1 Tax=Fischerella muscicola CCMEE 5323 TaxID=2019572 RepID=A0A2N6K451_FISMU|nr:MULTISPECIES: class I SAM-dependent methyltransferase [Fischerella]MBD2434124.1 class I SAM-dependent methyltransferase [Fischerella sp. FACHB-380]PLZ90684.1 class I SAM-dependent methyltransferase [Fischerella muscicola CCMEE 5323]
MQLRRMLILLVTGISAASLTVAGCTNQQGNVQADAQTPATTTQFQETPKPDVPYVPTSQEVVNAMLQLAEVNKNDVVYDLGSGDGRIPITAAQKYGVRRAVGVEINPELVQESKANAEKAGVSDRVTFLQQDLFQTKFDGATVVTLYLLPDVNLRLRPKLLQELKPGTRIVSHAFDMGEWKPQKTVQVQGSTLYLWVVPEEVPKNLLQ